MCEKRKKKKTPLTKKNQTHDTRVYCLPMVPKHQQKETRKQSADKRG